MTRSWPSREEWQAKAEQSVRTFCTPSERLERINPGAVWSTLGEDVEMEELAKPAATALRPLLTAEIERLRAKLPDRPTKTKPRVSWFVALEGEQYEDAQNLGSLEQMRREVQKAARAEAWGVVAWQLRRVFVSYPAIKLPGDLAAACVRMGQLVEAATERRRAAAQAAEDAAVVAEVARRATDEAWAEELEHRERVDSPRVIRYPA